MAGPPTIDWNAVIADPRFQELHRKKQRFLTSLMVFAVAFYFLLPVGAAYFQELFRTRVWGVINFGLLFALAEFVVAWLVAYVYSRRAGGEFDRLAREIAVEHQQGHLRHEQGHLSHEQGHLHHEQGQLSHEQGHLRHQQGRLIHEQDHLHHEQDHLRHEQDHLRHEQGHLHHEQGSGRDEHDGVRK